MLCYHLYMDAIEKQYCQNVLRNIKTEVTALSKMLGLSSEPEVVLCPGSIFPTPTTQALAVVNGNAYHIKLNIDMEFGLPYEFIIAHELRHIYQIEYIRNHDDKIAKIWREEARNAHRNSLSDYNLKDCELDANAFATYVYALVTGRDIQIVAEFMLHSLPDNIIGQIIRRAGYFKVNQ